MNAFRIRVPATSANLGPGFDCLGLALNLHLKLECRPAARFELQLSGEGADELPRDATNLLVRALVQGLVPEGHGAESATERPLPAVALRVHNDIPLARGLGSSAAATVAGLATGRLLRGVAPEELDREWLLDQAARIEGHPDNVAPAILGQLVVSGFEDERVVAIRETWPEELLLVAVIPALTIHTEAARRALPAQVAFGDAVANAGRLARLLAALRSQRFDLLAGALQDVLHQPSRLALAPGLDEALDHMSAHPAALGAYLSGSGPTLIAICKDRGDALASSVIERLVELRIGATYRVLTADSAGLQVKAPRQTDPA